MKVVQDVFHSYMLKILFRHNNYKRKSEDIYKLIRTGGSNSVKRLNENKNRGKINNLGNTGTSLRC